MRKLLGIMSRSQGQRGKQLEHIRRHKLPKVAIAQERELSRLAGALMKSVRIDVYAHFRPDFYRDALVEAGQTSPDGFPRIPTWSEEAALNKMDQLQIEAPLVSSRLRAFTLAVIKKPKSFAGA